MLKNYLIIFIFIIINFLYLEMGWSFFRVFIKYFFIIWLLTIIKVFLFCSQKSSKESKKFFQIKKLEMLQNIKDSLERKTASVNASIEVLEKQIDRNKED